MAWVERDKHALHFVFTYVGHGSCANVEYIASKIPDSHLAHAEHEGLSWRYACVSPPGLGSLDGLSVYMHVEAYEGPAAAKRARYANTDALCVLLDPARQLVPLLHLTVARQSVEEAGLVWATLPVAVQVLRDAPGGATTGELQEMTGEGNRSWFESTPASGHGVFDTFKALVKAALTIYKKGAARTQIVPPLVVTPGVLKIHKHDEELAAAYEQARASLDDFTAKLKRPRGSSGHAVHTCLYDGEIGEHVWLSDVRWDGKRFTGTLDNAPVDIRNHRLGDTIEIAPQQIEDWMYFEGGKIRGGYTIRLQARRGNLPAGMLALL